MAKGFKLPKRIGGVKVPRPARKVANRLLERVQGEELEALIGVMVAAVIAHLADREGKTKLKQRLGKAVGGHLVR